MGRCAYSLDINEVWPVTLLTMLKWNRPYAIHRAPAWYSCNRWLHVAFSLNRFISCHSFSSMASGRAGALSAAGALSSRNRCLRARLARVFSPASTISTVPCMHAYQLSVATQNLTSLGSSHWSRQGWTETRRASGNSAFFCPSRAGCVQSRLRKMRSAGISASRLGSWSASPGSSSRNSQVLPVLRW